MKQVVGIGAKALAQLDAENRKSAREVFEKLFPEDYSKFKAARTAEEQWAIHDAMLTRERAKLAAVLGGGDGGGALLFSLTPDNATQFIEANGGEIETVLQTTVQSLANSVPNLTTPDQCAAAFFTSGVAAMGIAGIGAFNAALGSGVVASVAMAAGIEALTLAGAVGIVVLVIVAIFIPIPFFMLKPATTFICVINQTQGTLYYDGDYEVSGQVPHKVESIPGAFVLPGVPPSYSAGIFTTSKRDNALVGTQWGFNLTNQSPKTSTAVDFGYGAECPLTAIYVDNNCYTGFNMSAEALADATDNANVQNSTASYPATNPTHTSVINCNSGGGSHAYYIALAQQTG